MADVNRLRTIVEADPSNYEAGMRRADHATDEFAGSVRQAGSAARSTSKDTDGLFSGILSSATKLGGVSLGFFAIKEAIGASVGALKDWSSSAAADEASVSRLDQTLKNAHVGITANSAAIQEYVAQGQKWAFSDDAVRDSLNTLIGKTGDLKKSQELLTVAEDLARAKKLDLATATKAVFKADDDSIGMLQRYGIAVDKNATSEQNLQAIRAATAGQAEIYAKSQEGSMARISDAAGEMGESIGYAINELAGPAIQWLADTLQSDEFQHGFGEFVTDVQGGVQTVGNALGWLKDQAQPALTFLQDNAPATKTAVVAMFAAIAIAATAAAVPVVVSFAPVLLLMAALGAAAFVLKKAWDENWGGMREMPMRVVEVAIVVFEGIKSKMLAFLSFVEPWVDGIGQLFQNLAAFISGEPVKAGEEFHSHLTANFAAAADDTSTQLRAIHEKLAEFAADTPQQASDAGIGFTTGLSEGIYPSIYATQTQMDQVLDAMGSTAAPAAEIAHTVGRNWYDNLLAQFDASIKMAQQKAATMIRVLDALAQAKVVSQLPNATELQERNAIRELNKANAVLDNASGSGGYRPPATTYQQLPSYAAHQKAIADEAKKSSAATKKAASEGSSAVKQQAQDTVVASSQIVSALADIGTKSTTEGQTLVQALGPALELFSGKFPAALQFVKDDYQKMMAGLKDGTLSMSDVTAIVEKDLQAIASSSDVTLAAMGQDALQKWHAQQQQISDAATQAAADEKQRREEELRAQNEALATARTNTLTSVDSLIKELGDPKRSVGKLLSDSLDLAATASAAKWPEIEAIATKTANDIMSGAAVDFDATAQAYLYSLDRMYAEADPKQKALILQEKETWQAILQERQDAADEKRKQDEEDRKQTEMALLAAKDAAISNADKIAAELLDPQRNTGTLILDMMEFAANASAAGWSGIAAASQGYIDKMLSGQEVSYSEMLQQQSQWLDQMLATAEPKQRAELLQYKQHLADMQAAQNQAQVDSLQSVYDWASKYADVIDNPAGMGAYQDAQGAKEAAKKQTEAKAPSSSRNDDLQFLKDLADPKSVLPSKERIQEFYAAQGELIIEAARQSEELKDKLTPQIAKIAANQSEIMGGLEASFDVILKLPDVQKVTREQIEGAFSNVWFALHELNEVMKSGELQGTWKDDAKDFADTLNYVFTALASAADLGKVISGGNFDFAPLTDAIGTLGTSGGAALKTGFDPSLDGSIAYEWQAGWREQIENWFRYTWSIHFINEVLIPTMAEMRLAIQGESAGFGEAGSMLGGSFDTSLAQAIRDGKYDVVAAAEEVAAAALAGAVGVLTGTSADTGQGEDHSTESNPFVVHTTGLGGGRPLTHSTSAGDQQTTRATSHTYNVTMTVTGSNAQEIADEVESRLLALEQSSERGDVMLQAARQGTNL